MNTTNTLICHVVLNSYNGIFCDLTINCTSLFTDDLFMWAVNHCDWIKSVSWTHNESHLPLLCEISQTKSSRLGRNPNYEFRIRTKKCPMQIVLVSWSHKCCQVDKQKAVSVYFYLSNVSCIPSVMFLPAKFCCNFTNVSTPLIDCINLQHHLCLRCTSACVAFGKRFPDQFFKPVLWTRISLK